MTTLALEEARDAAEAVLAKVSNDPSRIAELGDDDLTSLATHLQTQRPIVEGLLVSLCGDTDGANAALQRALGFPKTKLVKLVRAAYAAMHAQRSPSVNQFAAFVINTHVGIGAVQVEQERRATMRANRMN